jgi:hypothetical protein
MNLRQTLHCSALAAVLGVSLLPLGAQAPTSALLQKFAKPDQTMEYHFMLKAPAFTPETMETALAPLMEALKAFGTVGKFKKAKEGAYYDTRDRYLERAHILARVRPGLFTIKSRATNPDEMVDLPLCQTAKYELDYFEEIGYSISAELRYPKEKEWLAKPISATTLGRCMEFTKTDCPALYQQLEVILKPLAKLTAPGVAKMYGAEFVPNHPLAPTLKESGISAWTFVGTNQTLVEIAWTGYEKNKAELDLFYRQTGDRLEKAGLLALDQSSKTEQYFQAYYGSTALDTRYGRLAQPTYIKHFEADNQDKIVLSPYQQVGTRELPAFLDPELAPYDWVINAGGHLAVVPETMAPYGRTYEKGFTRPEDKSVKKPGTEEHYGHVAALAGLPGRISGELRYDKKSNTWSINNKSGRYSMHNPDRTPDQLINAAALIKETADIQGAFWGPVRYILEYGPKPVAAELERSPNLTYEDPAKKKRAFVELIPSTVPVASKARKEKKEDKDKPKDKDKEKKS